MNFVIRFPSLMAAAFAVMVLAGGAAAADPPTSITTTRSFSNTAPIVIVDDSPAALYPSSISVTGMTGLVARVAVTLVGLSHPFPDDLDVLLVAPSGQQTVLMSDAGGSFPVANVTVTFTNGAPVIPNSSQISSGSYSPGNFGLGADVWLAPAPGGPYPVGLTNLNGGTPNGVWRLFVVDDALESDGTIAGGWRLTVTSEEILPALSIARVGQGQGQAVQISWPATSIGFSLKSQPRLSSPPDWASVTNSVTTSNGQNRVTVPIGPGGQFFRLQR